MALPAVRAAGSLGETGRHRHYRSSLAEEKTMVHTGKGVKPDDVALGVDPKSGIKARAWEINRDEIAAAY